LKIVVTGGLGFIGSNFIIHLITENSDIEIINIDKMGVGANLNNLQSIEGNPRYKFVKGDISEEGTVKEIISDADMVLNFAAETHVDRSISDPKSFLESNFFGTFNLLEAQRQSGRNIRHIQISTDEVYGDILSGSHDENDKMRPSNPYSATKGAADLLCLAYTRTCGQDIVITRCTNNFGPRQYSEKLIPKTIHRALNDDKIPIYGTGQNKRDWLYVVDHCRAINMLMEKGKSGETYNISADNEYSVNHIVGIILDYMGKPRSLMEYVEDRPGHDVRYSLDSSKIRKLGWKPEYMFTEALHTTIDWYRNNTDW
jgi:dTDP-glucose 4,6-dehydratase